MGEDRHNHFSGCRKGRQRPQEFDLPYVLEETTSQEIDRNHVMRRVDDWADRVSALYADICNWLPAGWTAQRRGVVKMHEQLMHKFGVPARDLPVLELSSGERSARLEPRGLWIIGANGRLDLFAGPHHYMIIDTAENLQPPQWQIAPFSDRRQLKPLDSGTFGAAL
jgi:hypothetical protein